MKVFSSFLPEGGITVNVSDELTLKEIFIEAQRLAVKERKAGTRKFRKAWYKFFRKKEEGFSFWNFLEVKVSEKMKWELNNYVKEKKRCSDDMNQELTEQLIEEEEEEESLMYLTLGDLKKILKKDVISKLEIDIVGQLMLTVGYDYSEEEYNGKDYPIQRQYIPFDSDITIDTFILLALLCRKYKEGHYNELNLLNAAPWGIWFGLERDWKYFTNEDHIRFMAAFYEELVNRTFMNETKVKLKHLHVVLRKQGIVYINNGPNNPSIKFKFSEVDTRLVSDYADKLPRECLSSFGSQNLSLLVTLATNGVFTPFPVFSDRDEYSIACSEAFDTYMTRGEVLKRLWSKSEDGSQFVNKLREVATLMASKKCFTAICAPSLSGKTQLAFALEKNVLFFPLLSSFTTTSQTIYRCFEGHVNTLLQCASFDYELGERALINMHQNKRGIYPYLPYLTATQAGKVFGRASKSLTVGYFFTVIQALANSQSSESFLEKFWKMEGFKNEAIIPMSMDEFENEMRNLNIDMPFIFLDEFPSPYELNDPLLGKFSLLPHLGATLRNILREMKQVCLVMGTDTRLTNLAGTPHLPRGGSREEPGVLWCAIFSQFPRIPEEFFDEYDYKGLSVAQLLEAIKSKISELPLTPWFEDKCLDRRSQQIHDFLKGQLVSSRPGVAWALVFAIAGVKKWDQFDSVISFLQYLCYYTYDYVFSRKRNISEYGAVCSLLGNRLIGYYEDKNYDKFVVEFQRLIDRHFYYIKSPFSQGRSFEYFFLYHDIERGEDFHGGNFQGKHHFPSLLGKHQTVVKI